jgi:integrase
MPLTDTACRQLKFVDKPIKRADSGGLYLLVNKAGKYWRWKYRFDGKEKVKALGVYPVVSLAEARVKHREGRNILANGIDPMVVEKAKAESETLTFEVVAQRWHAHWAPDRSERHATYVSKRLSADVFPEIGSSPVSGLSATDFRKAVQKIQERGALDIAKRALQTCNQIMRYAVANGLTDRNPVADVKPGDILRARRKRNYARIGADELPALLRAIGAYDGTMHTRLAIELMALTFVRTGELIAARWLEIDLPNARWNIPAARMKMRTPHIVPLSRQAMALLGKLKSLSFGNEYLFPADVVGHGGHMSNNTILYALYRMGYRGRMTGHGFRGVASTILHEQGWPHEQIELQLAHQERDDTSAAYNHALYLSQRATMMQAWADFLDQQANVVTE